MKDYWWQQEYLGEFVTGFTMRIHNEILRKFPHCPKKVVMPDYSKTRRRAQINHDQSFETLARRGGLSPCEVVAIVEDRPWRIMGEGEAMGAMRRLGLIMPEDE